LQKFPHNIWIGMDGSVTFAKVTRAHECAFEVPLSKVLLETGAPTTIPSQISKSKGREAFCHSGLVPYIAESIAEFKSGGALDVSAEEVARAASTNTILLYPKLAVATASTTVKS
jgi:Tat protein secretion system quality control protein TatD with DNase activity